MIGRAKDYGKIEGNTYANQTSDGDKPLEMLTMDSKNKSTKLTNRKLIPEVWAKKNLRRKECVAYAPIDENLTRCFCGREQHEPALPRGQRWDPAKHIVEMETNAVGEIEFYGIRGRSRAKYVRLSDNTDMDVVLEFLLNQWGLKFPKLLISVTGGAKDFRLPQRMRDRFSTGLQEVTKSIDSWVVTGGTNTGVMKQVGKALRGASRKNFCETLKLSQGSSVFCLGIATWGIIDQNEKLINVKQIQDYQLTNSMRLQRACLDNNHTHFLLVDKGYTEKYGGEIDFRNTLEKYIVTSEVAKTSVVLLVLEGGINTIKTVVNALKMEPPTPVVVIKDSGRAADILSHVYSINDELEPTSPLKDVVDYAVLMKMIQDAFPTNKEEEHKQTYHDVIECMELAGNMTICDLKEGSSSMDEAILKALLHCKVSQEMLDITLQWNRLDLAVSHIFSQIDPWKGEEHKKSAMRTALLLGRVEFVDFFVSRDINMASFLTRDDLEWLYNKKIKCCHESQASVGELKLTELLFTPFPKPIDLSHVETVIVKLLGKRMKGHYTQTKSMVQKKLLNLVPLCTFQHPYYELFIWTIICNMKEAALYFLRKGERPLATCLIGYKMLSSMKGIMHKHRQKFYDEQVSQVEENIKEFADHAVGLLKKYFRASEKMTEDVLTSELETWGRETCLSLAASADFEEFVAHSSCQKLLTDRWYGGISFGQCALAKLLCGIILPPVVLTYLFRGENIMDGGYDLDDDKSLRKISNHNNEKEQPLLAIQVEEEDCHRKRNSVTVRQRLGCCETLRKAGRRLATFYSAPIVKFSTNLIAYFIFLLLYASVVLVRFDSMPSIREWILLVFVISLTTEELRQFLHSDADNMADKFAKWSSSYWNICDFLGIALFYAGFALRFFPSTIIFAHLLYSLDIMLWIVRLLEIFSINSHLGPYVVMIGRMTVDMMYFLFILAVFLLAYGIARLAILLPNHTPTWNLIGEVLFVPYFQVYGEMFFQDSSGKNQTVFGTPKVNSYSSTLVTMSLAFFLLVANILLLNLLIAIFNNTYEDVKANSDQIWKFQRYHLIIQYSRRPFLVPPLVIFQHISELFKFCYQRDAYTKPDSKIKRKLDSESKWNLLFFEWLCLSQYMSSKGFSYVEEDKTAVILSRMDTVHEKVHASLKIDNGLKKSMSTLSKTITSHTSHCEECKDEQDKLKRTESIDEDEEDKIAEDSLPEEKVEYHLNQLDERKLRTEPELKKIKHPFSKKRRKTVHGFLPDDEDDKAKHKATLDDDSGLAVRRTRLMTLPFLGRPDKPRRLVSLPEIVVLENIQLPALEDTIHRNCRKPMYPYTQIKRFMVPNFLVNWEIDFSNYSPPSYSQAYPPSEDVDPSDFSLIPIRFNEIDGQVDRRSCTGKYEVINGFPRNPKGRTGLHGRGNLNRWGPNHNIYSIITREMVDSAPTGELRLEFLACKSGDTYEMPMTSVKVRKRLPADLEKHISSMLSFSSPLTSQDKSNLEAFTTSGIEVYSAYVDHPWNTDNAWQEISVINYHDANGTLTRWTEEAEMEDTTYYWVEISSRTDINRSHLPYLIGISEMRQALPEVGLSTTQSYSES